MHEGARKQKSMRQSSQKSPYNRNGTIPPRPIVVVLQCQTLMPSWHVATLHPPAKQVGRGGSETEWPHRGMSIAACGVTRKQCNDASACHRHNATTWRITAIPSYAPSPYRQHVAPPRGLSRNEAACEKGAEPCGTHCATQSGRATWDVRGQQGREP